MNKWSRRAFVVSGVAAGGAVVFGVAIRRGDRGDKVRPLVAGDDDAMFDVWLAISPDDTVTVIVPHAEMGQGAHTALATMLADELDADWSKVRIREAPGHEEYANYALARGYLAGDRDFPAWLVDTVDGLFFRITQAIALQVTGGSMSVRYTGQLAMRVAGAAARTALVETAAEQWQVPSGELATQDSRVVHEASGRSASYAELAPAAAKRKLEDRPTLKSRGQFRLVGTPVPRRDVPAKVDGSARFGIDVTLPRMKYAALRAAPVFGGRVAALDADSVSGMPGVRKVVGLGDAVAVIADGYWQARQALDRLDVRFGDGGNGGIGQKDIFERYARALDSAAESDREKGDFESGDAPAAIAAAARTLEAEYRVPFLAHATMEPMNCTALVRDGSCELWTGSQNPLDFARQVGKALDIDAERVTLHNQYLGGGFGRRAFADVAVQAARIAATVDYPVKLIWSREEDTRHDHYRQASISRFRAGFDGDGRVVAWMNAYVNKHDPAEAPHIPYAIDNQRIVYAEADTHVPWGWWRSVDHSLHAFFTESFVDELARAAGADPWRFRRELLASLPRYRAVLDRAAEAFGWDEPLPPHHGRGIAIHRSFGTIVAQAVEVEMADGRPLARRVVCAVDPGYAVQPENLAAQMESGIVYGLTAALYGEISIENGAVSQSNFHDYRMLRIDEAPAIETHLVESGGPLGGAGEPGTPPIAPAFVNAIHDATGIRIRELPVSRHIARLRDRAA